ncbi:MAG: hypothetical protein JWM86_1758 [Thermoleophilia bacterium]|nr:hypothetical protein [Thermoleophilia bacterium]
MQLELLRHPSGRGTLLRAQVVVPRSIDETFEFFADPRNLEALTPPWLRFRVTSGGDDGTTYAGQLLEYRLRLHGFPISWRTRISRFEAPHAFADEQLRGPYAWWRHEHRFEAIGPSSTRMYDEVSYRSRGGALVGGIVDRLFVRRDVERIFRWRAERLLELLPPLVPTDSGDVDRPTAG